jgi:hypothetical protein
VASVRVRFREAARRADPPFFRMASDQDGSVNMSLEAAVGLDHGAVLD